MQITIYTLWASMKDEEPSPWMIAAEDEFSWEADAERCEKAFAAARALADRNGWDVRETNIMVDLDTIIAQFEPAQTEGTVAP